MKKDLMFLKFFTISIGKIKTFPGTFRVFGWNYVFLLIYIECDTKYPTSMAQAVL